MKFGKLFILIIFVFGIFNVNIHSKISSRIEGIVTDIDTGQPIKDAIVHLFAEPLDMFLEVDNTNTDMKGNFKFEVPTPGDGRFFVSVIKDGYMSYSPFEDPYKSPKEFIEDTMVGDIFPDTSDYDFHLKKGHTCNRDF